MTENEAKNVAEVAARNRLAKVAKETATQVNAMNASLGAKRCHGAGYVNAAAGIQGMKNCLIWLLAGNGNVVRHDASPEERLANSLTFKELDAMVEETFPRRENGEANENRYPTTSLRVFLSGKHCNEKFTPKHLIGRIPRIASVKLPHAHANGAHVGYVVILPNPALIALEGTANES